MFQIDHHIHTTRYSPDSILDPEELIERARLEGLDGVVITEHDALWEPDELAELAARAGGLTILSGVEVSTLEGHFLVYGLTCLDDCPPGVPLAELIEVVKAERAAIVAAHPYRWEQDFDAILKRHAGDLDGLECASKNVESALKPRIDRALGRYPHLGRTGSSDSHEPETLGCFRSLFPEPIRTMPEFVAALRDRKAKPTPRPGSRLVAGPAD